jgi:prophage regulatory protein
MSVESLELMRIAGVMKATGMCRAWVYLEERKGSFPKRVKIGRASAWVKSEVDEYIRNRMAARAIVK